MHAKSPQSCPTLCDPMYCSPPGSSVPGILQARILEWVAMPSSRESSWPRDLTHIPYSSCIDRQVLYHWRHLGIPWIPSIIHKWLILHEIYLLVSYIHWFIISAITLFHLKYFNLLSVVNFLTWERSISLWVLKADI